MDQDEFRRLPAELAVHRAGLALLRGDVEDTFTFARRALELVRPDDDPLAHGAASALQGLAAWSTGDLELAHTSYAASLVDFERIDHISDVLGCAITLADIQVARGRLRAAMRTYERGAGARRPTRTPTLRGQVGMHVGRAALHRELDDLRRRQERADPESRARRACRPAAERLPLAGGDGSGLRGGG